MDTMNREWIGTPARRASDTLSSPDMAQANHVIGAWRSSEGITATTAIEAAAASITGHGAGAATATAMAPRTPPARAIIEATARRVRSGWLRAPYKSATRARTTPVHP